MSLATVPVIVPPSGDGPIADVSALVGQKTVLLSGFFDGTYVLLGSDDDATFVPVLTFDSDGKESIRLTTSSAFKSVRVRSDAIPQTTVTVEVTGVSKPGENLFRVLATFPPGGGAPVTVDTSILFPPTGLEEEIAILCAGGFTGVVVVEGSSDNVGFNTVGIFRADPQQRPLVGLPQALEFSPLATDDLVRYLRLSVQGQVTSTVTLTIGGRIPSSLGTGGTLIALSDSEGRLNPSGAPEAILYEWATDLTILPPGNISVELCAILQNLPGEGDATFNVYVGSVTPGDTTGGVLRVSKTISLQNTEVDTSTTGVAFINPGGPCLVQVTAVSTVGQGNQQCNIRGVSVNIG